MYAISHASSRDYPVVLEPGISPEQDSTHAVLVEQRWIYAVSLSLHKVVRPEDIPQQVVYPNQLGLCWLFVFIFCFQEQLRAIPWTWLKLIPAP